VLASRIPPRCAIVETVLEVCPTLDPDVVNAHLRQRVWCRSAPLDDRMFSSRKPVQARCVGPKLAA